MRSSGKIHVVSCQGGNRPDLELPNWKGQRDCWGDPALPASTVISGFQYNSKGHPICLLIYITNRMFLCVFPRCVSLNVLVVLMRAVETHSLGILSLPVFSMISLSFVTLNVTWYEQKQHLTWAVCRGQNGGFQKGQESKQSQEESSGSFKGLGSPHSFTSFPLETLKRLLLNIQRNVQTKQIHYHNPKPILWAAVLDSGERF